MGYIGKEPSAGSFEMLDDLTASATATYALQKGSVAFFPGSANQLIVSLNGVVQEPGVSFTIAGSNIVFSSALTSADSIDFILALGGVGDFGEPGDASVTTAKIADDAVTSAKVADDAITSALIADDAITSALIADDAITSALIADDAVGSAAIADDAITSALIADNAVVTAAINGDAVTADKIADDAVESEHLNDNVISGQTELAAEPADTDEFLVSDGGVLKRMDYSHIKAGAVTVSQKATTTSTGTFTISSLTANIPVFICGGNTADKAEFSFRVTSGTTAPLGQTHNTSTFFGIFSDDTISSRRVPGTVLIPTGTSIVLSLTQCVGTLTAFQ